MNKVITFAISYENWNKKLEQENRTCGLQGGMEAKESTKC